MTSEVIPDLSRRDTRLMTTLITLERVLVKIKTNFDKIQ